MNRSLARAAMEWPPVVRIYESRLWRRSPVTSFILGLPFERERELILRGLSLRGSETALDLACGPGIYTRTIAREVPEGCVVGLDLSLPMLAYATRQARSERLGNVLWVRGDAMDLPFADGRFDAVNCCGALHLFPDLPRALAELHRVLRRGGGFTAAMARRGEGLRGDLVARLLQKAGASPLTEAGLRDRLAEAGFAQVQCHHARRAWMIWSARS